MHYLTICHECAALAQPLTEAKEVGSPADGGWPAVDGFIRGLLRSTRSAVFELARPGSWDRLSASQLHHAGSLKRAMKGRVTTRKSEEFADERPAFSPWMLVLKQLSAHHRPGSRLKAGPRAGPGRDGGIAAPLSGLLYFVSY